MNEILPAHSLLGASTSDRWGNCPGSVNLSKGLQSKSSVYAEEGTKAHLVASTFLEKGGWMIDIDEEMIEAVRVYTDLIQKERARLSELFIEQRLDLSSIHPKMFGTADAVIYYPEEKLLRVYDYKHGSGVPVEVKENSQLQYYGLGALLQLNKPCIEVELVVVQPRCYHPDGPIRRWKIPAFEMLDFAANLKELAYKTEEPNAPLVPGDHCRWCPAAGICPKLHEKAVESAKTEFSPTIPYEPSRLAQVLNWLDVFEGWAKSVRDFAYNEAEKGRVPPGWKLVQKRAMRKWKPEVEVADLCKALNIHEGAAIETKMKSPAQVEKILKKPEKEILETFCVKESSGYALVSESDTREAVKLDAKSQFTQIADPQVSMFD
jgi:hypothetical protein